MTERVVFVARLANGERMTDLCQEFGISRKTGYKFWSRFKRLGAGGLEDESRAPRRQGRRTSKEVEQLLVEARRAHPTWGGRKLKDILAREQPGLRLPSPGTIALLLKRNGLVTGRRRRRYPETPW